MFIRKYWLPLSVFLVAIAGIGLYLLATQPPPEPVKIYKVVEPEKPTEQPKTEAPVGDTSQGGHVHADGTWHEGAHETPAELPDVQRRQFQNDGLSNTAEVPRSLEYYRALLPDDVFSPEYIAMVKAAVQTSIALFDERTEDGLTVPEFTHARNVVIASQWDASELRQMFYVTGDRSYLDRCYQIEALDHPYRDFVNARYPKPKLNADELAQIEKAADELDALLPKNPLGGESLRNPYRERLQGEENR